MQFIVLFNTSVSSNSTTASDIFTSFVIYSFLNEHEIYWYFCKISQNTADELNVIDQMIEILNNLRTLEILLFIY